MATTGTLKALARLAYVRSIADQYEEQAGDISDHVRGLMGELRSRCDMAMECWQETLWPDDMRRLTGMLEALGQKTPLGKRRDITTYTAFGLCLLEDVKPKLKPHKAVHIHAAILALMEVHAHFTGGREYYGCLRAGADGADAWDELIG